MDGVVQEVTTSRAGTSDHILVVEDDKDLRDTLCEALALEGYVVTGVEHGAAALRHLHGGARPCLILLDLMMPVMDGWTFRREMLNDPALAAIPVVLITAAGEQRTSVVSAEQVLHKPLFMDAVVDVVRQHCTGTIN
jgi:CheY-like chemotaxis protein